MLIQSVPPRWDSDLPGLPLGNVTSQLFANIYLNKLDQFAKHTLKEKYYLRYCDDFIILGDNENYLRNLIPKIAEFLQKNLKLNLHPDKIIMRKYQRGIDFLGYVVLPHYRVLRTKTKRRILRKIKARFFELQNGTIPQKTFNQSFQSYLGILKHCEGYKIRKQITLNYETTVFCHPEPPRRRIYNTLLAHFAAYYRFFTPLRSVQNDKKMAFRNSQKLKIILTKGLI